VLLGDKGDSLYPVSVVWIAALQAVRIQLALAGRIESGLWPLTKKNSPANAGLGHSITVHITRLKQGI
jgi:hypothetical protein